MIITATVPYRDAGRFSAAIKESRLVRLTSYAGNESMQYTELAVLFLQPVAASVVAAVARKAAAELGAQVISIRDNPQPQAGVASISGTVFLGGGRSSQKSAAKAPLDVFISHAHEDKEAVARPLARELHSRGIRVWYDEFSLSLGDSLRQSIDRGLAESRFGVVVLSPSFFAKEWPMRELNGLTSLESAGRKVILPIWHGIQHADVARHSPMLADRLAISTDRGITALADAIVAEVRR